MGLLGLFVLGLGGASMLSDYCTRERLKYQAEENAINDGIPFYSDYKGNYYYIPTGEVCDKVYDYKTGDYLLKNKRTQRVVFNISQWQKESERKEFIRHAKEKVRETKSKYVIANFEGERIDYHFIYLFDVDTMVPFVVYEEFPFIGKYKKADINFVDGNIKYINIVDIPKGEFQKYKLGHPTCYRDFSKDINVRLREWRNA